MSDIDAALAKAKTEFLEGIGAEWSELHEYAEKDFEAGFKAGFKANEAEVQRLDQIMYEERVTAMEHLL